MSKKNKKNNDLLVQYKNLLRGRASSSRHEILRVTQSIRQSLPENLILPFVSWLVRLPHVGEMVLGPSFVRDVSILHRRQPYSGSPDIRELAWTAAILSQHTSVISKYVLLSSEFSTHVLRGEFALAIDTIDSIARQCGFSLWAIENRIAALQGLGGLEKQKEFAQQVKNTAPGSFAAFIAHYVSNRNEETITPVRFLSRFRKQLNSWDISEEFRAYLEFKVAKSDPSGFNGLMGILRHDATNSIIDLYESFVYVLKHFVVHSSNEIQSSASAPALVHLVDWIVPVSDPRLIKLKVLLGMDSALSSLQSVDLSADDKFLAGDYAGAITLAQELLDRNPLNVPAIITKAKSMAHLGRSDSLSETPLLEKMSSLLVTVYVKAEGYERSMLELIKMSYNFGAISIVQAILNHALLESSRTKEDFDALGRSTFLCTPSLIPQDVLAVPSHVRPSYVDVCREKYTGSLTLVCADILRQGGGADLHLAALSQDQALLFDVRACLEINDLAKAASLVGELLLSSIRTVRLNGARHEIEILVETGQLGTAYERTAYWCSAEPAMRYVLPVDRLVFGKPLKAFKPYLNRISTPILFDLALQRRESEELRNNLRWSCDEFLAKNEISRPSEITQSSIECESAQLIYFLRRVCVPSVLEACRGLKTSKEIDEERINICSLLTDLDAANAEVYREEITFLTTKLKIEEGVQIVDRSRIYVDTDAIARWATRELRETFDRYKAFIDAGIQGTMTEFESAFREFAAGNKPLPVHYYLELPTDKGASLLIEMVYSLRKEFFFNSEHGLDFFLSMRVRHGSLSGTLRGPLDDRKLTTVRDEESNTYKPNQHWPQRIRQGSAEQQLEVGRILAWFSEEYDKIIEEEVKPMLNVFSAKRPHGCFGLSTSPLHLHLMQTLSLTGSFEQFIDDCFHVFNQQLKAELDSARKKLDSTLRTSVGRLFQGLYSRLGNELDEWQYGELKDAIAAAYTEVQNAVVRVVDWFYLEDMDGAEVSFSMQQIFEIAVSSGLRTLRGFTPRIDYKLDVDRRMSRMVLNELVDIVFIALDNAYKHSGMLSSPYVKILVRDETESKLLRLVVESEVSPNVYSDAVEGKLALIRSLMNGEEYRERVAREGGSGLVKIKRIASQHKVHSLDFGFRDAICFFVDVGFSLIDVIVPGRPSSVVPG